MNIFQFLFGCSLIVAGGFVLEPFASSVAAETKSLYASFRGFLSAHAPHLPIGTHEWHPPAIPSADPMKTATMGVYLQYEKDRLAGNLAACDVDLARLHHLADPAPLPIITPGVTT
jgi:hypothetical protein